MAQEMSPQTVPLISALSDQTMPVPSARSLTPSRVGDRDLQPIICEKLRHPIQLSVSIIRDSSKDRKYLAEQTNHLQDHRQSCDIACSEMPRSRVEACDEGNDRGSE